MLQVDGGVHEIDVFLVQLLPQQLHAFAEALEVNDLPFPQELDGVVDIGVIGQTQNVVVCLPGLLLSGHVLRQVGNGIAAALHAGGAPGRAGGGGGIDGGGVVHKIGGEALGLNLLLREVAGQLVDDGADHLQVAQLLGADVG